MPEHFLKRGTLLGYPRVAEYPDTSQTNLGLPGSTSCTKGDLLIIVSFHETFSCFDIRCFKAVSSFLSKSTFTNFKSFARSKRISFKGSLSNA